MRLACQADPHQVLQRQGKLLDFRAKEQRATLVWRLVAERLARCLHHPMDAFRTRLPDLVG